jgi:hypothetical protein
MWASANIVVSAVTRDSVVILYAALIEAELEADKSALVRVQQDMPRRGIGTLGRLRGSRRVGRMLSRNGVPVRHRWVGGRIYRVCFLQATRGQSPSKQGIGEQVVSHGLASLSVTFDNLLV